jgi:hypothetical protein
MAAPPTPPRINRNRYTNGIQAVHRGWNRVCDAWNTVIYASQILRVLQDEEDSSVELLCRRLVENEPKLLQLGWMMVGDYYTSKELDELVQAMMHNTSVSTVSIGWSLRPYSIHRMLGAVVYMPQVENLSLVLHTSLRVESLELLKRHHSKLKRLQIQNVQLRRRCCDNDDDDNNNNNSNNNNTNIMVGTADNGCMLFAPRELWYQDYNIVDTVADWHQLDTLQLLDCDLQEHQIVYLTQKARERPTPWTELSVAYNPHVGGKALIRLISKGNARRLDVTSCNVTPPGARALAKALTNSTTETALVAAGIDPNATLAVVETSPLESLCLARNVYMGYGALPLITAAARRLKRLDVSHCQLPVQNVWGALREAASTKGGIMTLTHLGLQGYTDYPGLRDFLKDNLPSLKTLQLSSSSTSTPISKSTQQELLEGLDANYFVQEVAVFVDATTAASTSGSTSNNHHDHLSGDWWKFDFALQLNRIGRCILHDHNVDQGSSCSSTTATTTIAKRNEKHRNWSQVLERASGHPDCLYWLLRNGVGKWNPTTSTNNTTTMIPTTMVG